MIVVNVKVSQCSDFGVRAVFHGGIIHQFVLHEKDVTSVAVVQNVEQETDRAGGTLKFESSGPRPFL